ncbi:hypothetical protein [Psychrobacter sp. P11G3]|uniref:hypothetical protein n=1 Tax=Psychrobacter sp. P11G3 TaxID=1699623 RepID=UPI00070EF061|nr:hypothetical protein [Psychrobacter sp. P11G3]
MANIKTLEQKRQEALDKANRLQKQIEKQLNGQKFVLGGMLMKIAEEDPSRIPQILADIDKYVTRKADISRLESFKVEIGSKVAENNDQGHMS